MICIRAPCDVDHRGLRCSAINSFKVAPRHHPRSLSCSSTVRNGLSKSRRNLVTTGSPTSRTTQDKHDLKASESIALEAATNAPATSPGDLSGYQNTML